MEEEEGFFVVMANELGTTDPLNKQQWANDMHPPER
jgi:hypothetical protein